jgi:multicomponent Na+:H+ antiporter subunit E
MKRSVVLVVWLTFVWVLLWGDVTIANIVGGLLAGALVIAVAGVSREHPQWRIRPLGVLVFAGVFLREMTKANLIVLRQVLTWRNTRFQEAVIAYPAAPLPPPLLVVLGELITLTPGTMTLETDPAAHTLYVHALHMDDAQGVIDGIRVLERIVVRAFATDEVAAAAAAFWSKEASWTS